MNLFSEVYEYICARYGVRPDPGSTIMVDYPISEEEYAYPNPEDLPKDSPIGRPNKEEVRFPGLEFLFGFGNLIFSDSIHYELQISQKGSSGQRNCKQADAPYAMVRNPKGE